MGMLYCQPISMHCKVFKPPMVFGPAEVDKTIAAMDTVGFRAIGPVLGLGSVLRFGFGLEGLGSIGWS